MAITLQHRRIITVPAGKASSDCLLDKKSWLHVQLWKKKPLDRKPLPLAHFYIAMGETMVQIINRH